MMNYYMIGWIKLVSNYKNYSRYWIGISYFVIVNKIEKKNCSV